MGGIVDQDRESDDRLDRTIRVQQRRLDQIVTEPVTLLKIDAEGADLRVLQSAKKLLAPDCIDHICFEHNLQRAKKLGIGRDEPFQFLEENGYEVTGKNRSWWARPSE
jgi:hypothetical protein